TQVSAETSNWIERDGIGHVTGVVSWTTEAIANVSAWVEREIVNRTEDLVVGLTHVTARLAQRLEGFVFHTGIHVGMPLASGRIGHFLNTIEEILGRPAVIGSLVFLSFVALLLATL
ncbi:MAG: hypothetical protein LC799_05480, partial [Actinobacteria bacterium]|nr:hypothetical protein [Actinomycetota bacterium]